MVKSKILREGDAIRYFDKEGNELHEGDTVAFDAVICPEGKVRTEKLYLTTEGTLGTDATNGNWRTDLGDLTALESRSYRVSSDNKCFGSWYCGYSLFGASLDGKWFERLEDVNWIVEYCYLEEDN